MINIIKTQPAPPCLEVEKARNGNYRCGNVVQKLKTDFKNKCYICEYKRPPTINVEHFKPHKENIDLKFDWNNLFYCCGHCNGVKSGKFDNILDCTNPEHDVLNWIKYEIDPFPKSIPKITAIRQSAKVINTANLINEVYNSKTPVRTVESENIRKKLLDEIVIFQDKLIEYFDDETDNEAKKHSLKEIKKHLNKKSHFTAFKRWIILNNEERRIEFEGYFV